MPKLPAQALLMLAAALSGPGCASQPLPLTRTATTFVVPTELPNGRVEIGIAPSYSRGATVSVPVALVASRGSVVGPLTARILASGINEGGAPAEVLVRTLAVAPVTATAPGRATLMLTWDTRDGNGQIVPPDAYSLMLEVRATDSGASRTLTAGATLELR